MRRNNRRASFEVPSKLIENKDKWEKIAKGLISKDEIKGDVYKGRRTVNGKTVYEVRETLTEIYYYKCAYCESIEYKPEVEHYRPKKEVKEDTNHPGYYWLCYEWSNLLPSCRYCNTEGGKGNYFPVIGPRVSQPPILEDEFETEKCDLKSPELTAEAPILLHPEIDDVEDCFFYELNGKLFGSDDLNRGEETIKICNLNRDNLLARRQKEIDNHLESIEDILLELNGNLESAIFAENQIKKKLDRLKDKCLPEKEYSLLNLNIIADYEELIIDQLQTELQKEFVRNIYNEYMEGQFEL